MGIALLSCTSSESTVAESTRNDDHFPASTRVNREPLASATARSPQGQITKKGIPTPPDRDLENTIKRLRRGDVESEPITVGLVAEIPQPGEAHEFWLVDVAQPRIYRTTATVRLITEHAIWYVESNLAFDPKALDHASEIFESTIYPRVTGALGTPSFEEIPKLSIFNGDLKGSGGYFNSNDLHPNTIHPYSNQRPILYINSKQQTIGTETYLSVLAHEFQHFIHNSIDHGEETWVNEGLSELASEIAGYPSSYSKASLPYPRVSLINWPTTIAPQRPYYLTSLRFFRYLTEHYNHTSDLKPLVKQAPDGAQGINTYLATLKTNDSFIDAFQSWAVQDGTHFINANRSTTNKQPRSLGVTNNVFMSIQPFAPMFIPIAASDTPVSVRFTADTTVALLPMDSEIQAPCWWGNKGDSIHTKLTREIDLTNTDDPTLSFQVWHDIELGWDYAYVTTSTDEGESWQLLKSRHMTEYNPVGNALGPGYSGTSNGWISDQIDLSPFTGGSVLISFEYLTDDALHGPGICINEIQIEADGMTSQLDQQWESSGFYYTNNRIPADFRVSLLEFSFEEVTDSRALILDQDNSGEIVIGPKQSDSLVIVSFVTEQTTHRGNFTLSITEP